VDVEFVAPNPPLAEPKEKDPLPKVELPKLELWPKPEFVTPNAALVPFDCDPNPTKLVFVPLAPKFEAPLAPRLEP
jgi:hypothetical protein